MFKKFVSAFFLSLFVSAFFINASYALDSNEGCDSPEAEVCEAPLVNDVVSIPSSDAVSNSSNLTVDDENSSGAVPNQLSDVVESPVSSSVPVFFYGDGCSHCANVEKFFEENGISVPEYEIYHNQEGRLLFNKMSQDHNVSLLDRKIPMLFVGDKFFVGDKDIIEFMKEWKANGGVVDMSSSQGGESANVCSTETAEVCVDDSSSISFWLVVGAALVDAVNPCAFAVLLILLTAVLVGNEKKKTALLSGFAFSLSIFIAYFLMGLGVYHAISSTSVSSFFFKFVAVFAILLGIFNLKDFFWYGKGFLMEVPRSWRPLMKSIIHKVTSPVGAFFAGIVVSFFLLPCTSGPYVVILTLLSEKESFYTALFYLVLYNLIFVLPMVVITLAVYFGFSAEKAEKIRKKNLRVLHLIAGVLMVGMGVYLLVGF